MFVRTFFKKTRLVYDFNAGCAVTHSHWVRSRSIIMHVKLMWAWSIQDSHVTVTMSRQIKKNHRRLPFWRQLIKSKDFQSNTKSWSQSLSMYVWSIHRIMSRRLTNWSTRTSLMSTTLHPINIKILQSLIHYSTAVLHTANCVYQMIIINEMHNSIHKTATENKSISSLCTVLSQACPRLQHE